MAGRPDQGVRANNKEDLTVETEKSEITLTRSIEPCNKSICSLDELHKRCSGVIILIDSDKKPVYLSFSPKVENIAFCLWRQNKSDPNRVKLIIRLQGFMLAIKQIMPFLEGSKGQ